MVRPGDVRELDTFHGADEETVEAVVDQHVRLRMERATPSTLRQDVTPDVTFTEEKNVVCGVTSRRTAFVALDVTSWEVRGGDAMATLRELGAQLRSQRKARGETQQRTAAALGVTRQWLARVEAGTGNPDLRQLLTLCEHLGLDLTALPPGMPLATTTRPGIKDQHPTRTGTADERPAPSEDHPGSRESPGERPPPPEEHERTVLSPQVDLDELLKGFTDPGTRPAPDPPGDSPREGMSTT